MFSNTERKVYNFLDVEVREDIFSLEAKMQEHNLELETLQKSGFENLNPTDSRTLSRIILDYISSCVERRELQLRNINAFLFYNPCVKTFKGHCHLETCITGKSVGYSTTKNSDLGLGPAVDHPELLYFDSDKRSYFMIAHCYRSQRYRNIYPREYVEDDIKDDIAKTLPPELKYVVYDPKFSWYYPYTSDLTFIAKPEILKMLNLEYLGEPLFSYPE